MPSRILIVEDEQHIADGLAFNLRAEGHAATVARDGEQALDLLLLRREPFDAVILDVMLPGKDGFTVAAEVRAAGHYLPILMLTARSRPEDVLRGFEAGADDYLQKPFELAILIARVNGLLRRHRWNEHASGPTEVVSDSCTINARTVDFAAMEIRGAGQAFKLTQMECELLRHLIRNAGRVVSRRDILENVWGLHEDTDTRAIDNFIVRLRRYLEERPSAPRYLVTVRGVGYQYDPEGRGRQKA